VNDVPDPEIGREYKVISGPHRGREGVCDLIKTEGVGTRYRLTNREGYVGRFAAEQLAEIAPKKHVSKVSEETQNAALDLMMAGRKRA
jgi:hypothetical protein